MDRVVRPLLRGVDTLSEWTGRIVSPVIYALTGIVVFGVVSRYLFNKPTIWVHDASTMLYGAYFMLGAAYTLRHKGHVSIDIISLRLSPRARAVLEVVFYLIFFFPFFLMLFVEGWKEAGHSWAIGERLFSGWKFPLYPLKTVIPVAVLLLLLQGLAESLRSLIRATKGKEL